MSIQVQHELRNPMISRAVRLRAWFCVMIVLPGCLGEIEGTGRSQSVMVGTHDICTANGFSAAEMGIGNKFYPRNENAHRIDVYKNNVAWSGEKARLGQMSVSRCLTPPVNQSYVDQQLRDQASWQDDYNRALAAQQAVNGAVLNGVLNGIAQGVAAYNAGAAASGGYNGGSGYSGTGGSGTGCGSECVISDIRLKTNIHLVGRTPQGIALYSFS